MAKIDLNEYLERLEEQEDREKVANRDYQRQLFLDYVVRGDNFPERRAQLLRDFEAGKELTGPKGLRRKLGAFDLEYFGRAYLAHYFGPTVSRVSRRARSDMARGRHERARPQQFSKRDLPGRRVPPCDRGPSWSRKEHDLHLQGLHPRGGLCLQAL